VLTQTQWALAYRVWEPDGDEAYERAREREGSLVPERKSVTFDGRSWSQEALMGVMNELSPEFYDQLMEQFDD
jgi:hypothetical protein